MVIISDAARYNDPRNVVQNIAAKQAHMAKHAFVRGMHVQLKTDPANERYTLGKIDFERGTVCLRAGGRMLKGTYNPLQIIPWEKREKQAG